MRSHSERTNVLSRTRTIFLIYANTSMIIIDINKIIGLDDILACEKWQCFVETVMLWLDLGAMRSIEWTYIRITSHRQLYSCFITRGEKREWTIDNSRDAKLRIKFLYMSSSISPVTHCIVYPPTTNFKCSSILFEFLIANCQTHFLIGQKIIGSCWPLFNIYFIISTAYCANKTADANRWSAADICH